MMSLQPIITPDLINLLSKFYELGGVMNFTICKITGANSDQEAHCLVARRTLEELSQNNEDYPNQIANSPGTNSNTNSGDYYKTITVDVGIRLTPEQFFGPYFNFKEQRPILLGTTGKLFQQVIVYSEYYYYDDPEIPQNIVIVINNNSDFATQGYTDAFLNPPHSFGKKAMTNYEIGKYFLEFNQVIFDNINDIKIYSWPTDCSDYFKDGKEWWGSFFWTVYNPTKDWYIGIAVSTTD